MNTVEKLMSIDAGLFKKNTGILNMVLKRVNLEVEFECEEVDSEQATRIDEEALNISVNGGVDISSFNTKIKLILLGCSLFSDKKLQNHFNCDSPKDLIKKMLTKDEIDKLANFISELGGLADDKTKEIEDIKN